MLMKLLIAPYMIDRVHVLVEADINTCKSYKTPRFGSLIGLTFLEVNTVYMLFDQSFTVQKEQ